MNQRIKPLVEINISTLLISTAAVIAKLSDLPAPILILFRCLIAALFLLLIKRLIKSTYKIDFHKHGKLMVLSGVLLAAHWITYFFSIQISSIAIAVITLFTFPAVTALLEPLFFGSSLKKRTVLFSLLILLGIIILVPVYDFGDHMTQGLMLGLISSVLYAIRNLLSKKFIAIYSGYSIMFHQLVIAAAASIPVAFFYIQPIPSGEIIYLLFLGVVTTAVGHVLFVKSLQYFEAAAASVIAGLQPVLAIFWAFLIVGEAINARILLGGFIILTVVTLENLIDYRYSKKS